MRWGTRKGVHIDRAACAWLIRRFVDPQAEFTFVDDPDDLPHDATPFDIRGAKLSHVGGRCSFETFLVEYHLTGDLALARIAQIVHEADIGDEAFDAPEAAGLDMIIRGLSLTLSDDEVIERSRPLFDGLYALAEREAPGNRFSD
jgi:hypothetical protein